MVVGLLSSSTAEAGSPSSWATAVPTARLCGVLSGTSTTDGPALNADALPPDRKV